MKTIMKCIKSAGRTDDVDVNYDLSRKQSETGDPDEHHDIGTTLISSLLMLNLNS
jgi:hypothetical protein